MIKNPLLCPKTFLVILVIGILWIFLEFRTSLYVRLMTTRELHHHFETGDGPVVGFDHFDFQGNQYGPSEMYLAESGQIITRGWWYGKDSWRVTDWNKKGQIILQRKFAPGEYKPIIQRTQPPWLWGEVDQVTVLPNWILSNWHPYGSHGLDLEKMINEQASQ